MVPVHPLGTGGGVQGEGVCGSGVGWGGEGSNLAWNKLHINLTRVWLALNFNFLNKQPGIEDRQCSSQ